MSAPRLDVDLSRSVNGSDDAVLIGRHTVDHDGEEYIVSDAFAMDIGSVECGDMIAGVITLYRCGDRGFRMGLSYTVSAESARTLAGAFAQVADDLEAAAATAAAVLLAKVAGK